MARSVRRSRTSRAQWQRLYGTRFESVEPWFEITDRFAKRVPKPNASHDWLAVVEESLGNFAAVDECTGRMVAMDPCDLAIHEFNFQRLVTEFCTAIDFEPQSRIDRSMPAWLIGIDAPEAGRTFPTFLQRSDLRESIMHVVDVGGGPAILVTWVDRLIDPVDARRVESASILLLTLADIASIDSSGKLRVSSACLEQVAAFQSKHLPARSSQQSKSVFSTPAKARWSDVKIRFVDAHTVHVSVLGVTGRFAYFEMGLSDRRSGRPNKQWEFLYGLARNHGEITWRSPDARRENKKRRKFLSSTLQEFFRIEGEPIELTTDKKGYRASFQVEPD